MKKTLGLTIGGLAILTTIGLWWRGGLSNPKTEPEITIGIINSSASLDPAVEGFKQALQEMRRREGRTIRFLYHGATPDPQELDREARRLLEAGADLIYSVATPATLAAKRATEGTSVPIVFGPVTDPVGAGIVESLRVPGRNATGIRGGGASAKALEWLLETSAKRAQVLVLHDPGDMSSVSSLTEVKQGAEKLGTTLTVCEKPDAPNIIETCGGIPPESDALLILPSSLLAKRAQEIVDNATARRLPVGSIAPLTEAGVLLRYGEESFVTGSQAARLTDRILNGASASKLPVETPDFVLTINLKAAERIGLTVPDKVLSRADRILR